MTRKQIAYETFMAILAVASMILITMDYAHKININYYPYSYIDNGILIIFSIDYFSRLILSKDKVSFVRQNIFDLLSIIPVNNLFAFFRIARIGRALRLLKVLRILRLIGLTGRLQYFLKTKGLVYYSYISLAVLLIASSLYCVSEKVSFVTALWWAITTATTVGYGDISPTTMVGKLAAVLLMLLGIGFIGMLTSSLTSFFDTADNDNISNQLDELKKQNQELERQLQELKQLMMNNKE